MSKNFIKRLIVMIISGIIIGLGVAFFVKAELGADSMTTFEQGLSVSFNIDLALCSIIANALFAILTLFVNAKALTIPTLIYPLFISLGIKLTNMFLPNVSSTEMRIVYMFIGLIMIGVGIGLGSNCDCGNNPYDGFVLCLSEKIKFQYKYVRMLLDAIILVVGILLKGSFGIGTIVAIVLQGAIAQWFIEKFKKSKTLKNFIG